MEELCEELCKRPKSLAFTTVVPLLMTTFLKWSLLWPSGQSTQSLLLEPLYNGTSVKRARPNWLPKPLKNGQLVMKPLLIGLCFIDMFWLFYLFTCYNNNFFKDKYFAPSRKNTSVILRPYLTITANSLQRPLSCPQSDDCSCGEFPL